MNQEKIGSFIAETRKLKKMTQTELAEKLGVTDRSVSNWENGKNMPDLSLFKPLCEILGISINELLSGEKIEKELYQVKFEENIINTIDYSNKKINKSNNIIGIILIIFGVILSITALTVIASESSWGSVYSVFGAIISLIGVSRLNKRLSHGKRLLCNFGYFIMFIAMLLTIDYIGVININQAPRFSSNIITFDDTIYYDTPFYDVIRCNKDTEEEKFIAIKNINVDFEKINTEYQFFTKYCE